MSTPNLFPIYFIDAPKVLDASVTPIPGSGSLPLQVITDSGVKMARRIDYIDTTGDYIGVYIGAAAAETLVTIIGGGLVSKADVVIPAHSRVSLRSMATSTIAIGKLTMVFMGFGL